ncbi:MAG TPA: glycosyltransferase family 4 protein [Syntrophobacteraceae bacterium]|nr:glycosyltransferase family 4 protein [Syntrophobacteraceae bacterium]
MKIAFVTPEYITEHNFHGGLANYLSRVAQGLLQLGQRPIVIVASDREEYLEDKGVPVYRVNVAAPWEKTVDRIPLARRLNTPLKWLWQSRKLNERLSRLHSQEHIDVVQYASYTATALFGIRTIPSIIRLSSVQEGLDLGYGRRENPERRLLRYLDFRSMKNADRIFAPSHLLAHHVEQMVGKHVTVIESPYVAPESPLDTAPYDDLLADKHYILTFGSLGLLKGIDTIAEIIHDLLNTHPRLHYVFLGKDMGFQGRPMMQHVWEKAGSLRARVMYMGIMPHAQLYPIIRGARLVVLPSKVDNLPNTCIEAMAMGKVVIGTQGASFEQLIENNANGFLCPMDNPQSLKETIEAALAMDDHDMLSMGRKAAERIELLKPERVVEDLLNTYRDVIASRNRA